MTERLATTILDRYLHHYCFSISFSLSRHFLIKGVLGSKTYLPKVDRSAQYPRVGSLSTPRWPSRGPLAAILDFAGGERVPPAPLRWYLITLLGYHLF